MTVSLYDNCVFLFFVVMFVLKTVPKQFYYINEKLIKTIPVNTSVIQKPQKLQSVKNNTEYLKLVPT